MIMIMNNDCQYPKGFAPCRRPPAAGCWLLAASWLAGWLLAAGSPRAKFWPGEGNVLVLGPTSNQQSGMQIADLQDIKTSDHGLEYLADRKPLATLQQPGGLGGRRIYFQREMFTCPQRYSGPLGHQAVEESLMACGLLGLVGRGQKFEVL